MTCSSLVLRSTWLIDLVYFLVPVSLKQVSSMLSLPGINEAWDISNESIDAGLSLSLAWDPFTRCIGLLDPLISLRGGGAFVLACGMWILHTIRKKTLNHLCMIFCELKPPYTRACSFFFERISNNACNLPEVHLWISVEEFVAPWVNSSLWETPLSLQKICRLILRNPSHW